MTRPGAFKALMPATQEWWTVRTAAGVSAKSRAPRVPDGGGTESLGSGGIAPAGPLRSRIPGQVPLAFGDAIDAGRGFVDRETSKLEGFRSPTRRAFRPSPRRCALRLKTTRSRYAGST